MKKGPLSKEEKSYIEKHYQENSVAAMAGDLNRSEHMVEKHVAKMSFENKNPDRSMDDDPSGNTNLNQGMAENLFARNKERGVTIMTENASMAADETKAKRKEAANGVPARMQRYIHKIKE